MIQELYYAQFLTKPRRRLCHFSASILATTENNIVRKKVAETGKRTSGGVQRRYVYRSMAMYYRTARGSFVRVPS